ncbi:MAG: hypothetical protein WD768_07315 [Phycisphaeraceae bacterium]
MNVLTKVFVVLVTILSVVLVSLVIPFVANQENFREQVEAVKSEVAAAKAEATLAKSLADVDKNIIVANNTALKAELDAERTTSAGYLADAKAHEATIASLNASLASARGDLANLTAANNQMTKILGDASKELVNRRDENLKQGRQIVQLEAANNELEASRATLIRAERRMNEQKVSIEEELREVRAELDKIPVEVRTAAKQESTDVIPPVPIRAQVTDVQKAGEGTTLVQLNVGSIGGIKERMKFLVHRGEEYLGSMVIITTDLDKAVGRIQTLKSGATIQTGDSALAGRIGQ